MAKTGSFSINSDNIFPIIKKWLYSDRDIFVREMISNGCDAITKLNKLSLIGEYNAPTDEKYEIHVEISSKDKTISFIDNGIGMTEDEVDQYINQIAFSGARDFLEKYKDKANDDQIIGHFGLGFYSAFMVADKVTIDTLSYKDGSKAVHWESNGGTEYEMTDGSSTIHGTKIILHLTDDNAEFSNEYRVKEVLDKYCSFMPVPIYLVNIDAGQQIETIDKDDLKDDDIIIEEFSEPIKDKDGKETGKSKDKVKIEKRPIAINDIHPLWTKHPNECTKEEYEDFYHKTFRDYKQPLFWIHLNMDYPFNLKGILYFPKINTEYESIEGTIKLYNNQVFIADNIKEVIPEYLLLLKGVIDCPDLPLNVSRSALQNDGFVGKIRDYITKKVAEKLIGMCKTDREEYEKYWDDISPFIKFGCLKDEKFCEKMNDYMLFKNIEGKYLTFKDCIEENKEKYENKIFYISDEKKQHQYIEMFKKEKIDAVYMTHNIDMPFISQLESKNKDLKFLSIDTDLNSIFAKENKDSSIGEYAKVAAAVKESVSSNINVRCEALKDDNTASLITVSEESLRMQNMMKQYGMAGMDLSTFAGEGETLVLNTSHPLVRYLKDHIIEKVSKEDNDDKNEESSNIKAEIDDTSRKICLQLYDLARISHGSMPADKIGEFITRSNEIMEKAYE